MIFGPVHENLVFSQNMAATCDFLQYGVFTSVDSGEPVQPSFKLRISKCCSVSSLKVIEYLSN